MWYTQDPGVITPIQNDDALLYQTLYKNFREVDHVTFDTLAAQAKDILVAQRTISSGALTFDGYITIDTLSKYKILQNDIYTGQTTIYLHRHSQHLNDFWIFLGRVEACGLLQHWEILGTDNDLHLNRYLQSGDSPESKYNTSLTLEHTKGIFAFWILGMLTSLMIFAWEVKLRGYIPRENNLHR